MRPTTNNGPDRSRSGNHRALGLGCLMLSALLAAPVFAESPDEEALRHLKTVLWPQAYRTQDVGLLDALLHDSFQLIDDTGRLSDKAQELAWIRENAWNPGRFEYRIERLDVYDGRWAIVAGTGEAEKYRYRSSNVLIKKDGRWQAVASHVSGYEEK